MKKTKTKSDKEMLCSFAAYLVDIKTPPLSTVQAIKAIAVAMALIEQVASRLVAEATTFNAMNSRLTHARHLLDELNAQMRDPVNFTEAIQLTDALRRHLVDAMDARNANGVPGWPALPFMPVIKPLTETLLPAPKP